MMPPRIGVLSIAVLLSAGCSKDNANVDVQGEVQAVRAADRALLRAETDRNLDAAMEYIAEGSVFQPPNSPAVVGSSAIREFYRQWFKIPYSGIGCESDAVLVSASGDLACLIGSSYMEFAGPGEGKRVSGKYLTIWRKSEGRWLCVAVSWSGNQPAQ